MKCDVVVIGLGAAGLWAAREALESSKDVMVAVVDRRVGYDTYSPCALPFTLNGEVGVDNVKHSLPDLPRLKKMLGGEVTKLNPEERIVTIKDVATSEVRSLEYGVCVVATGSSPVLPSIRGLREALGRGATTFSTPEDAMGVLSTLERGVRRALVVGCGVVGMEVSHALSERGVEVVCADALPYPLPGVLDEDMVKMVIGHLVKEGVDIRLNTAVEEILLQGGAVSGAYLGGEEVPVEMVIVAAGARPNSHILQGLVEMEEGYVVVDERMRTTQEGIYAAGDVTAAPSPLPLGRIRTGLASVAYLQGKVAGRNAAQEVVGGNPSERYPGSVGVFAAKVGALEVAAAGLDLRSAKAADPGAFAVKMKGSSLPDYFPGGEEMTVKIIADGSGKVVGGQIVGGSGVYWRINLIARAIMEGIGVDDLSLWEMAYTPPLSDIYDPLIHAADRARAKLKRRERG